jgi:hypothetical protein
MALRFLGKDDTSPNGDSPSIWDDGDTYVLQGWRVTDPAVVAELLQTAGRDHVPEHETLIRFPKRMMPLFPEVDG